MRTSIVMAALAAALVGCQGATGAEAPVVPLRNMHDQDRYDPQQESRFFSDGRTMRKPVANTVSQEMETDLALGEGTLEDGSGYVGEMPDAMVERLGGAEKAVTRGQQRYDIYCTPCHDGSGAGQGTAVKRGMAQPPTFHDDRLRSMPDGQLFATISNGVRNMPAYQAQIPVQDRWAIVSYVRALQLSQAK